MHSCWQEWMKVIGVDFQSRQYEPSRWNCYLTRVTLKSQLLCLIQTTFIYHCSIPVVDLSARHRLQSKPSGLWLADELVLVLFYSRLEVLVLVGCRRSVPFDLVGNLVPVVCRIVWTLMVGRVICFSHSVLLPMFQSFLNCGWTTTDLAVWENRFAVADLHD